jgi:hypothetical protein
MMGMFGSKGVEKAHLAFDPDWELDRVHMMANPNAIEYVLWRLQILRRAIKVVVKDI